MTTSGVLRSYEQRLRMAGPLRAIEGTGPVIAREKSLSAAALFFHKPYLSIKNFLEVQK